MKDQKQKGGFPVNKEEGTIPSGNVENSGEFTHNPIHPAPEGSTRSDTRELWNRRAEL